MILFAVIMLFFLFLFLCFQLFFIGLSSTLFCILKTNPREIYFVCYRNNTYLSMRQKVLQMNFHIKAPLYRHCPLTEIKSLSGGRTFYGKGIVTCVCDISAPDAEIDNAEIGLYS